MAKHRFDKNEQAAVWNTLTEEEKEDYRSTAHGYELSGAQADRDRMRELENLGFARLKEQQ